MLSSVDNFIYLQEKKYFMVEVMIVLLSFSAIIFFGFLAEFLFKKIHVPDVLLLVIAGLAIGPYGFKLLDPMQLEFFAPLFTTFTLLFLLYDGAFNISLASLARGAVKSLYVTLFNFFISVIVICGALYAVGFPLTTSILAGCILGGVSSAFVIPLLKQMRIHGETYSILTLESAITDVLCIVSAFTVMEIIALNQFNFQIMISKIASLFAVAGLVGIIAGIIWIIIVVHVFKENKSYMITIAYLIMVYAFTEFLKGNGAIAALFFGLVLKNSKELMDIFNSIIHKREFKEVKNVSEKVKNVSADEIKKSSDKSADKNHKESIVHAGVNVTTETEQFFYSQISFLLKTFFFIYIGLLLNLSDTKNLIIGLVLAVLIMFSRILSGVVTRSLSKSDKKLVASIFARGLAAAAIAQVVVVQGLPYAQEIASITYSFIVFTIILSSGRIFFLKKNHGDTVPLSA